MEIEPGTEKGRNIAFPILWLSLLSLATGALQVLIVGSFAGILPSR